MLRPALLAAVVLTLAASERRASAEPAVSTSTRSVPSEEDVIILEPEPRTEPEGGAARPREAEAPPPGASGERSSGPRVVRASIDLEARASVDTRFDLESEQVATFGVGARFSLEVDLAKHLSVFAAPSFFYLVALDRSADDREVLYLTTPEAYVAATFGPFDLRAGALLFNWGSSDLIGPSDLLNPLDYRRGFVASLDDAKMPVLAAELVGTFGPLSIRAVVEPFFTPARFFLGGLDTGLVQAGLNYGLDVPTLERLLGQTTFDEIGDQLLINERPPQRPDSATIGARATLSIADVDLSLTAVHGWEPFPELTVHPDLVVLASRVADALASRRPIRFDQALFDALGELEAALERGEAVFRGRYRHRDVVGFDAVLALDPFIFKVESAYAFSRTTYTQDYRPVRHPWLTSVLGAEYLVGDEVQVIVEAFLLTVFDVGSSYRLTFFEAAAPPPSTTDAGERTLAVPGAATLVRYNLLDGDLGLELAAFATFTRGDLVVMPSIHYRVDDASRLTLGGTWIEGPADSFSGAYSQNDEIFVYYRFTH